MAKVPCSCGHVMSDNSDAHYFKAWYIRDIDWDTFWTDIDAAIELSGPSAKEKEAACMKLRYNMPFNSMFQCPACGALILEDEAYHEFKADPSEDRRLFARKD